MNNKGFTLVEILAVITIIGVIIVIAVPTTRVINGKIIDNIYSKKIELIEKGAILYGTDNKDIIISSSKKYNGKKCINIKVKDLVPEYIDSDSTDDKGFIKDDKNPGLYLDDKNIILYLESTNDNSKVNSKFDTLCS